MNKITLKGNWNELKGKVKKQWGKLTDDDLMQIEGSKDQLVGKLQQAYSRTKEVAEREVADFSNQCGISCDEHDKKKVEAAMAKAT